MFRSNVHVLYTLHTGFFKLVLSFKFPLLFIATQILEAAINVRKKHNESCFALVFLCSVLVE